MTPSFSPDTVAAPWRVAFVNTHPIQYFAPMYTHLTQVEGFDVTALYLSDFSLRGGMDPGFRQAVTWDVDLTSGYTPRFMGKAAEKRRIGGFLSMIAPQLWGEIREGAFDAVVIHGHNLAAHHIALAAARSSQTPVFTRGETHLRLTREGWRTAVRTPLLKAHYALMDGFLAIGSANAAYYRAMGVPEERISAVPYTVDNARFIAAGETAKEGRAAARERLGVTGDAPVILYASKFDPRKRPGDLLAAYSALRREGVDAHLVMIGTGQLDEALKAMVARDAVPDVSFPGFVNQAELPAMYAAADVFVLPSENEPWGLVVNEAMCAGLPVVLPDEVGCADDLVETGVNGATYIAGDVAGLTAALRPILTDQDLRACYGAASLGRIKAWSYAECAAGLSEAIVKARLRRGLPAAKGESLAVPAADGGLFAVHAQ